MTGKESALTVLMETVEVRQVFAEWPDGMNLAVCLLDSGECRMFIYRREEAGGFPSRMRRYLNLPVAGVSIFPEVPGYPTRKLLYSDERRLLSLVADAPDLVEEAVDYSANYLFALEEGLDPTAFLRRTVVANPNRRAAATANGKGDAATREAAKPAPKSTSKPATPTKRQGSSALSAFFLRESSAVLPGPQFRSASEISATEEPPGLYRLEAERNGWIVIEHSGARGGDVRVSNPSDIFLRDDRRVIAVRLEPAWPEDGKLPRRILIRAANLPHSLRMVLAQSVGEVRMKSDGNFLFLHLPEAQPVAWSDPDPVPEPVAVQAPKTDPIAAIMPETEIRPIETVTKVEAGSKSVRRPFRRRLWLSAGIASLLVLIGIGLRFGAPAIRSDEPTAAAAAAAVDWNRYRTGGQSDQSG